MTKSIIGKFAMVVATPTITSSSKRLFLVEQVKCGTVYTAASR